MTGSTSSVRCVDLSCGYSDRKVLADVDLEFHPGTVTAILGPNGAGKSTLLKCLTGEMAAQSGRVEIAGKDVRSYSAVQLAQQVAFVPQQEHFPFRFSAYEAVMMGRLPKSPGLSDTQEDRDAVCRALKFVDAENLASRSINELSGGERQRILLARALAQETPIVVLDEPTTHLDITHQIELVSLMKSISSTGRTVIAAMHDLNLVALMADDAVLLSNGRVVARAETESVLQSAELDAAYAVPFRRIKDGDKTIVLPPSA